jgi:hypothetical protein
MSAQAVQLGHVCPRPTMNHHVVLPLLLAAQARVIFISLLHLRRRHRDDALVFRPALVLFLVGPDSCGA